MSVEETGAVFYPVSNIICWRIPSFSLLSQDKGTRIWSPSFGLDDNRKNALASDVPHGSVGLILICRDGKETPVKCVRFRIVDMKNSEISCCDGEWTKLLNKPGYFRVLNFVSLTSLNRHWGSFKENPGFRLFCEVVKNHHCQMVNASTHIGNARINVAAEKAIADEGSDESISKNSICMAHEVDSQDLKSLRKLGQNLRDLYVRGKHSDVLIKVKDREFNVHKAVLTARSSVFDRMFSHDLSESKSGIVPIEDCEPAVFEEFLFFVYTGKTQHLSSDNACELYYVADKYDIPEMKEECISFLKKSLSIETICDVICLSTKCNESELLDLALTFFARNMEEIIVTVKWLLFMKENPVEANELTIKALKLGFTKREI